jgi:hypothetical protein
MFLSNFSIKQPVTTVAIVIVLMCLGLLALKNLRVNQIPDVEQPVMVINFPYPGASPESVERDIINRVEKPLQSIPQVYELHSTASDGNAQFVIIFELIVVEQLFFVEFQLVELQLLVKQRFGHLVRLYGDAVQYRGDFLPVGCIRYQQRHHRAQQLGCDPELP